MRIWSVYTLQMRRVWNKGLTKESDSSVRKIATTMKHKKIDNFRTWRKRMQAKGSIKSKYNNFKKDGDLAELTGVILGDGSITKFPRTESLRIVSNASNAGFVHRYTLLVEKVFGKTPHVAKRTTSNAINITIYECHISDRIGIPTGAKGNLRKVLPKWIRDDKKFLIRYLRGLYEAEGSYCVHEQTYTHKLLFSNTNPALLGAVYTSLKRLGFHPHQSSNKIQVSKKAEVQKLIHLLQFRRYDTK